MRNYAMGRIQLENGSQIFSPTPPETAFDYYGTPGTL